MNDLESITAKKIVNNGWITVYPDKSEVERLQALNKELCEALSWALECKYDGKSVNKFKKAAELALEKAGYSNE